MKKFLFTLAALMMAGSLCAEEYLYIDDFEVAQSELGTEIEVVVKAHFDYMVSAWEVNMQLPEGLTPTYYEKGADMKITYKNSRGRDAQVEASLGEGQGMTRFISMTSATDKEYYQDETGAWVEAGAIKWQPGDYDEMFIYYLEVSPDFKGGDLTVITKPTSGADARGEVCPKNQENVHICHITVEGGQQPEVTEAPVITYETLDDCVIITATGNGTVTLYVNNELVENPYTVARGEEDTAVIATAFAQEEGKEISVGTTLEVPVPAIVVAPKQDLTGEINIGEPDEDGYVTITYTGDEDVNISVMIDGVLVPVVDGKVFLGSYGEAEITVTVTAEGYNDLTKTVTVTWTEPQPPYETPAPVVTVEQGAEAVVITATGEGEVVIYVNYFDGNGPVAVATGEGEVTFEIPFGEEEAYVAVWATAQRDAEALVGMSESEYVTIPAKGGDTPVDPHMNGFWLAMVNAYGGIEWYEMFPGANGDYTTTVSLDYVLYGGFDPETEERPVVDYYFMINGERYGALEGEVATVLGTALDNELFKTDGFYTLPVGYNYNLGVAIGPDGDYYVYAAQASFVGVDELNANKTVAGVRYFNMAGQEMQEANGVTIVVTTYTDGTTSAVKVMK